MKVYSATVVIRAWETPMAKIVYDQCADSDGVYLVRFQLPPYPLELGEHSVTPFVEKVG